MPAYKIWGFSVVDLVSQMLVSTTEQGQSLFCSKFQAVMQNLWKYCLQHIIKTYLQSPSFIFKQIIIFQRGCVCAYKWRMQRCATAIFPLYNLWFGQEPNSRPLASGQNSKSLLVGPPCSEWLYSNYWKML